METQSDTVTVVSFKMPFVTTHFNHNQRVWVMQITGNLAALCCGRFRGRGRYVSAWVRWEGRSKPAPAMERIQVAADFATRHQLHPSFF